MNDSRKTKAQLHAELAELRRQFEQSGNSAHEQLYRALYETAPIALVVWDTSCRVTDWNRGAQTVFGWTREEVLGHSFFEFLIPEVTRPQVAAVVETLLRGELPSGNVNENLTKTGDTLLCEWTNSTLRDGGGRIIGALSIGQDITERRTAFEAIRHARGLLASVMNSSLDAIMALRAVRGKSGRVVDFEWVLANHAAERMLGRPESELLGQRTLKLFPHEDEREAFRRCVAVLETGEPQRFTTHDIEDGHDRWFQYAIVRLDDGVAVTFREITDVKAVEEALRESERKYRLLAEHSADVIWTMDPQMRFTYTSPSVERLFGYAPEDLLGVPLHDLLPADSQGGAPTSLELARLVASRSGPDTLSVRRELEILHKNGTRVWAEVVTNPVWHDDGQIAGLVGITRDISKRKEFQERMQQAQKLESLGVLAGGIAHDFNNLLAAILGNADLALWDLPSLSPARDHLVDIERATRRAADLCQQLLAYSGRGRFVNETINLSSVVHEMAALLNVSISKKALLRYHFAPEILAIKADPTQIRQVIMNLITNASEALGDQSGTISVATGVESCDHAYLNGSYLADDLPEGQYVFVEVTDTGCGMDEQTQRRIFDPFFTSKFTGRGLGLAAVLGIVRSHRGAIKVYSEPGKGSVFKVLFPVTGDVPVTEESLSSDTSPWMGSGTVLLVDDEEPLRKIARRMLERMGFSVIVATDGPEAIELFNRHSGEIACVVLDLTMPGMDGEEVFRVLRKIRKDLRVILVSGYGEQEVAQRFLGKGLDGFIQKPYIFKTMNEAVRKALEG